MRLFKDQETYDITKAGWCPPELRTSLLDQLKERGRQFRYGFTFSKAERKVFRKRKPVKVSEWAERHRVVTMSVLPGLWKNRVTPYLTGIMDAAGKPYVRVITVCKAPQTGVSEAAHNFVGYCIDRAPGPVLYVYPDETSARENSQDRIIPMIRSSKRLSGYFTGAERDKTSLRINLQHMPVYLGWARSASRLANKPIRYAVADEIDKEGFDGSATEATPLDLIDKRLTTYRPISKYFKISTPTLESGNIWRELNKNTDVIFDYYVRCPLCAFDQLMEFRGIKWEGGSSADPKQIQAELAAWYECVNCGEAWDDDLRNKAVRHGHWMARDQKLALDTYLEMFRPASVGFHLPAWVSYFVSLSECAASFIEGQEDPMKLQDFLNSYAAMPWKDIVERKAEDDILARKNHLPSGIVPEGSVALTCGIDMQKHGFFFVVRSWKRDLSNHLVQYGWLDSWNDVEQLVFGTRYRIENANEDQTMGIWRAALDTGGGPNDDMEWSRTEEAYHWIRKNSRGVIFGIKGENKRQIKRVNPRVIDKMARGNRPIPGGLVLYFLDTEQFKDLYHFRLSRGPEESQQMTLNADTGLDYARQILAEEKQKDRKGRVKWESIRRDNHFLDCEVYAAACADPEWTPSLTWLAGNQSNTKQQKGPESSKTNTSTQSATRSRPSWFRGR